MKAPKQDGRHRRRNVQQDARLRHRRRQRRRAAARHRAHRPRTRPGAGQARLDHAAHQVRGRGLRAEQGRRRPAHPVLHRLPAAVLLPHHRRDRHRATLPDGDRNVHARRQHQGDGGAAAGLADRHGREPSLRHPRRRPDRRLGRGDQDSCSSHPADSWAHG